VIAGRVKNAADLDALSGSVWGRYEIWPESEPQYAHVWITKSLMYEDPLYDCMNILKRRVDELAAAYGKIRVHAH
jgi:hypothetical protein